MPDKPVQSTPIQCVGVICFRGEDVLLIKRGQPPRAGDWSIPGGRIEPGETEQDAAMRELIEETGVTAKLGQKVDLIRAEFEGKTYDLHDYVATWISGEPRPADDVTEALFFKLSQIETLGMWPMTTQVIFDAAKIITV